MSEPKKAFASWFRRPGEKEHFYENRFQKGKKKVLNNAKKVFKKREKPQDDNIPLDILREQFDWACLFIYYRNALTKYIELENVFAEIFRARDYCNEHYQQFHVFLGLEMTETINSLCRIKMAKVEEETHYNYQSPLIVPIMKVLFENKSDQTFVLNNDVSQEWPRSALWEQFERCNQLEYLLEIIQSIEKYSDEILAQVEDYLEKILNRHMVNYHKFHPKLSDFIDKYGEYVIHNRIASRELHTLMEEIGNLNAGTFDRRPKRRGNRRDDDDDDWRPRYPRGERNFGFNFKSNPGGKMRTIFGGNGPDYDDDERDPYPYQYRGARTRGSDQFRNQFFVDDRDYDIRRDYRGYRRDNDYDRPQGNGKLRYQLQIRERDENRGGFYGRERGGYRVKLDFPMDKYPRRDGPRDMRQRMGEYRSYPNNPPDAIDYRYDQRGPFTKLRDVFRGRRHRNPPTSRFGMNGQRRGPEWMDGQGTTGLNDAYYGDNRRMNNSFEPLRIAGAYKFNGQQNRSMPFNYQNGNPRQARQYRFQRQNMTGSAFQNFGYENDEADFDDQTGASFGFQRDPGARNFYPNN